MPIRGSLVVHRPTAENIVPMVEAALSGEMFSANSPTRIGEINPNYTRKEGQVTEAAIHVAEYLRAKVDGEEPDSFQSLDQDIALRAAAEAKLLNAVDNDDGTRDYGLSYSGKNLINKYGTDHLDVLPHVAGASRAYKLGSSVLTVAGAYGAHRFGVFRGEHAPESSGLFYYVGLSQGLGLTLVGRIVADNIRCLFRAKRVHNQYLGQQ